MDDVDEKTATLVELDICEECQPKFYRNILSRVVLRFCEHSGRALLLMGGGPAAVFDDFTIAAYQNLTRDLQRRVASLYN